MLQEKFKNCVEEYSGKKFETFEAISYVKKEFFG
jgi:hypothetical protein